jgi:hypothetical protein
VAWDVARTATVDVAVVTVAVVVIVGVAAEALVHYFRNTTTADFEWPPKVASTPPLTAMNACTIAAVEPVVLLRPSFPVALAAVVFRIPVAFRIDAAAVVAVASAVVVAVHGLLAVETATAASLETAAVAAWNNCTVVAVADSYSVAVEAAVRTFGNDLAVDTTFVANWGRPQKLHPGSQHLPLLLLNRPAHMPVDSGLGFQQRQQRCSSWCQSLW